MNFSNPAKPHDSDECINERQEGPERADDGEPSHNVRNVEDVHDATHGHDRQDQPGCNPLEFHFSPFFGAFSNILMPALNASGVICFL